MGEFRFYGHSPSKSGWRFSNFSNHPITIDGIAYSTSEAAFQAQKFSTTDECWFKAIVNSKTPYEAKKMGGSKSHILRPNWEEIKDKVMMVVLRAKAQQHDDFRTDLLSTGNLILIESSPYDTYWGEGLLKTGKNMLGKLLMQLREELRSSACV